jgi:hypothetical protein
LMQFQAPGAHAFGATHIHGVNLRAHPALGLV